MSARDGGPVHPLIHRSGAETFTTAPGMSLRQFYKAQLLPHVFVQACVCDWPKGGPEWLEAVIAEAARLADLALAEDAEFAAKGAPAGGAP